MAVRFEVDISIDAGEAGGEPFLFLATKFAVPGMADEMGWQLIAQPARLPQPLGLVGADLFLEFTQGSRPGLLALVQPALRHLPGTRGVNPLGGEDLAGGVEQSDTDPPAVRQGGRIDRLA